MKAKRLRAHKPRTEKGGPRGASALTSGGRAQTQGTIRTRRGFLWAQRGQLPRKTQQPCVDTPDSRA